ncbi:MAG: hypothetical protein ABEN55_13760 [Bradymonadaceae bacterium]
MVVSFSECYAPENAEHDVASLQSALPDSVDLVVGGRGAPDVAETTSFSQIKPFHQWAETTADTD